MEYFLQNNFDLTSGSLLNNLLKISLPTIVAFSFQTLNDLIDMMWIGNLSSESLAGVTIFTTVFWIIILLNNIIGTSSISLISQSFGAKNFSYTNKVIEQTITFKFIVSIIAAAIMFSFMEPLFNLFTKDPIVLKDSFDYGFSRLFFLPIMFSTFSVNTSLICIGDAKRQMFLIILSSIINLVLDPIFIFETIPFTNFKGLGMGVYGAAMATNISFSFAFLFGFWFLFKGTKGVKISWKGLLKLDYEIDKKLWTIGLPAGLENLTRSFGQLISLQIISSYGTAAIAVVGISNRLMGTAIIPLYGLMRGASAVIGQNLGAEKIERAEKTANLSALVGFLFMLALTFFALLSPQWTMNLFSNDPIVINYGITMIYILFPGYLSVAIMLGFASVFAGSGYNTPMLISGFFSKWFVQLPLILIFVKLLNLEISSIWWSYVFAEIIELFIIYYYFKKGKWKYSRV